MKKKKKLKLVTYRITLDYTAAGRWVIIAEFMVGRENKTPLKTNATRKSLP